MRRLALLFLASCAAAPATRPQAVCPVAAAAEKLSPEAALQRIVTAKEAQPTWFAKSFLEKVPANKVTSLVTEMGKELGGFQRIEKAGEDWKTVYAKGAVLTKIHLDADGLVDGLFFGETESSAFTKLPPQEALARYLSSKEAQAAWFSKSFLARFPISEMTEWVASFEQDLGAFQRVEKDGANYKVLYAKGFALFEIGLDDEGRIQRIYSSKSELFTPRSVAEVISAMGKLPGKVSVLVTTGDKTEGELASDAELAVGSAFKLAILAALKERVDAKKLAWTQVITLDRGHKSLPSGMLQDWPDGSPLTIHSLATLMISRSDNTATDLLLDFVGRPAVEKFAPGNAPFLATRDAFVLKNKGGADLLAKWRAGDEAARRKLLADIAKAPLPSFQGGEGGNDKVTALDVEWRFSAKRLCELLGKTKDLPMFLLNPGPAGKKDWDAVAYKGGSEPGVLNLSSWVVKGGKQHCVIATWNDPEKPVDEDKLEKLYKQLLTAVR